MTEILQDESEIAALADLVRTEGVRSYLEIGSKFGGSLQRVAQAMPVGSRVVSVDLPKGTKAWMQSEPSLRNVITELNKDGYDAHLIWGNSQDAKVIEQCRKLGPYDCILIDADHRLPGVTADWDNYGSMGHMIAFHDIAWHRADTWVGTRIDVPEFWAQLKPHYRHKEFIMCPTGKNNGIGVLWRN
jgi:predicted O-methyltransferase YrrM